jgi:hypothetical protein
LPTGDRVATDSNRHDAEDSNLSLGSPQASTILVRESEGKSQRVMVLDEDFAWNGATYRSLTEIAFAMTGTRWSGPVSSDCVERRSGHDR